MALTVGDRFAGHFEVTAVLGAGGMGEVYRARDTRLNQAVALKILPDAFAADPDRLARFQREAELLASLNHPAAPNMVPFVELSPDGRHLAYLESDEGREARLWVHSLESGQSRELSRADTSGFTVFWSPDSRFVAFSEGGSLRRIDLASGAVDTVCDTPRLFGGSWNADGVIVFGGISGIMQVSAGGGTPVPLTRVDTARGELGHVAPRFLPDGRHFLYLRAASDSTVSGLYVGALDVGPAEQKPERLVAT